MQSIQSRQTKNISIFSSCQLVIFVFILYTILIILFTTLPCIYTLAMFESLDRLNQRLNMLKLKRSTNREQLNRYLTAPEGKFIILSFHFFVLLVAFSKLT